MGAADGPAALCGDDGVAVHGDPASSHWFVSAASTATAAVAIECARRRVLAGLEGATDPSGDGDELSRRRRTDTAAAPGHSCLLELVACSRGAASPPTMLRRLDFLVRTHRPGTLTVFRHASLRAIPAYLADVLEVPAEAGEPLGALTLGTWDATAVALGCAPSFPFSPSNAFYRTVGERLRARATAGPGGHGVDRPRADQSSNAPSS